MDMMATIGYAYEFAEPSTGWMSVDKHRLCLTCYAPSYFSSLGTGLAL